MISIRDADPLYKFLHQQIFHAYCKFFLEPNFLFLEIFAEKGIESSLRQLKKCSGIFATKLTCQF